MKINKNGIAFAMPFFLRKIKLCIIETEEM